MKHICHRGEAELRTTCDITQEIRKKTIQLKKIENFETTNLS